MPRDLTDTQKTRLDADATRPIFVVEFGFSGVTEYLSCSGEIVFDGNIYTEGAIKVASIQSGRNATIEMPWSSDRMQQLQNGDYRGKICRVWHIPAEVTVGSEIYSQSDGIMMIDGEIRSARFSGNRITARVIHENNAVRYTPRHTLNELSVHIAAPGTKIEWEGEIFILESRR